MTSYQQWRPAPANLTLTDREVHVWLADLEAPDARVQAFARVLSREEISRASKYHFEHLRRHYIVGRGLLRTLLGHYLDIAPEHVSFDYNNYGKPTLARPFDESGLSFNLSHSGNHALLAFALGRELGVDIEHMRPNIEHEQIAERFFSVNEVTALLELPPNERELGFFTCWTRKEAYIKALGEGLSHPLDTFDVSLKPYQPARLLATRSDPRAVRRWSLHALEPGPGYTAALAVEGHEMRLAQWRWMH